MKAVRPKPRIDAWDARLTEAQRWEAYAKFREWPWTQVSTWIAATFKLRAPGRNALYRWGRRMRELESAHRIEQAITARDEAGALAASATPDDPALISAYKALAADIALRTGDARSAAAFTRMALDIAAQGTKTAELELRARAQATKDEALALAREKFTAAEARLSQASAAVADKTLTPEQRQQRLKEIFGLK